MRISDWSSDVCSSDLSAGQDKQDQNDAGRLQLEGPAYLHADGAQTDEQCAEEKRGGDHARRIARPFHPCRARVASALSERTGLKAENGKDARHTIAKKAAKESAPEHNAKDKPRKGFRG